jgi:hypothetical protein
MRIREWFSRLQSSTERIRQPPELKKAVPDGLPAAIGFSDVVIAGQVRDAHAAAGPISDVPPPPIRGRQYRIVDVAGTRTREVASSWHFEDTLKSMPFGPVLVTLLFEPNEANPYGISAYVSGRQVGWLGTDWTANDPQVKWMKRLDAAGIVPRFQGLHRLTTGTREHIMNFDFPGRHDDPLDDIAGRIVG